MIHGGGEAGVLDCYLLVHVDDLDSRYRVHEKVESD